MELFLQPAWLGGGKLSGKPYSFSPAKSGVRADQDEGAVDPRLSSCEMGGLGQRARRRRARSVPSRSLAPSCAAKRYPIRQDSARRRISPRCGPERDFNLSLPALSVDQLGLGLAMMLPEASR